MAKFMALFTGEPGTHATMPDAETIARGMKAWTDWMKDNAAQVVDTGGPLGKTKKASKSGVADISNAIAGYVIIEAEDHATAAALFENHPHFSIFPGEGVEIMPVLPIPSAEHR